MRADGTTESRSYDAAGRTTGINDIDSSGQMIFQYDFTYDAADNITSEQSILPLPFGIKDAAMTYTSGNRLATFNDEAVEYDADGNMITGPLAGEMTTYTYDSRNRLLSAGNLNYQYDAENNRIGITDVTGGTQTDYTINPNAFLSQVLITNGSNGSTYYVYGLGLIGQENPDGTYQTYHYDLRGSTVALTDESGKVNDRFQYGPYGEMVRHEGDTATPFQYCGEYGVMTDANGLCYMRARYYNQEIRRFVNQDILIGSIDDSQSLNRFAYVNGEPVNSIDPFGLKGGCPSKNNKNLIASKRKKTTTREKILKDIKKIPHEVVTDCRKTWNDPNTKWAFKQTGITVLTTNGAAAINPLTSAGQMIGGFSYEIYHNELGASTVRLGSPNTLITIDSAIDLLRNLRR